MPPGLRQASALSCVTWGGLNATGHFKTHHPRAVFKSNQGAGAMSCHPWLWHPVHGGSARLVSNGRSTWSLAVFWLFGVWGKEGRMEAGNIPSPASGWACAGSGVEGGHLLPAKGCA